MSGGYQRPTNDGTLPEKRVILEFHQGTPGATTLNDVTVMGAMGVTEVQTDPPDATGTVRRYYAVTGLQGAMNIFVRSVNSTDLATMGGQAVDPKIRLWVDDAHRLAYAANNKEVFFSQDLIRQLELNLAFIRTGPDWSRNNYASAINPSGISWVPDWSLRPLPSSVRWSANEGVPWEVHCWLANELNVNLWVCIPFIPFDPLDLGSADALRAKAYVQGMAGLIKSELNSNLHCYVEWSNEIWNAGFTTNNWLQQQVGTSPAAQQAKVTPIIEQCFRWWLEVWNDCRVELMAMGKNDNATWAQAIVDQLRPDHLVDAVGCSMYFKPLKVDTDDWECLCVPANLPTTAELNASLLSSLDNDYSDAIAGVGTTGFIRDHSAMTSQDPTWPLKLYCYEGGPSLFTNGNPDCRPMGMPPCGALQSNYAMFQETLEMGALVTHLMDRLILGTGLSTPLTRNVDKFGYFAFCQSKNAVAGDFLLLTDLWAGLVGALDDSFQDKFFAVLDFNN
jgi:hypothetical protein